MRQFVKFSGIIAISLILASCGGGGMFKADGPETTDEILLGQKGKTLWESGLQYVKIVNQDVSGVANEQPAALTSDDLRTVLSSVYVSEKLGFSQVENPLFSFGELPILSTAIANGLGQANDNEDINFVSIGVHPTSLSKERKTNSGRVFISGGRLNIIFGLIHESYSDKNPITNQPIDRRLHPLLPGSRKNVSKPRATIALDSGQSYYLDPETGKERTDWLVIDIATVLKTAKERAAGEANAGVSAELLEDVARNKQESSNLRHDVSSLKEILFDLTDEIGQLKQQIEELNVKP